VLEWSQADFANFWTNSNPYKELLAKQRQCKIRNFFFFVFSWTFYNALWYDLIQNNIKVWEHIFLETRDAIEFIFFFLIFPNVFLLSFFIWIASSLLWITVVNVPWVSFLKYLSYILVSLYIFLLLSILCDYSFLKYLSYISVSLYIFLSLSIFCDYSFLKYLSYILGSPNIFLLLSIYCDFISLNIYLIFWLLRISFCCFQYIVIILSLNIYLIFWFLQIFFCCCQYIVIFFPWIFILYFGCSEYLFVVVNILWLFFS